MGEKAVKILHCSKDAKDTIDKVDAAKFLGLDLKSCPRIDLFLFAFALGVESGIETELAKPDTLVRGEYINTKNEALLYASYYADLEADKGAEALTEIGSIYGKAQKYANTGFKLIDGMLGKSEEVVRMELLKELDGMYQKIIGE